MSLSRFGKGLFLALALFTGPMVAFAQVSAIQGGVRTAATAASLTISSCSGTTCLINVIGNVIKVAINFSGVILLCYLLYAGFLWMTASGDPKAVTTAQDMIKNAVAGLVLITISFAISSFVLDTLGTIATGQTPTPAAGASGPSAPAPAPTTPTATPPAPTTQ